MKLGSTRNRYSGAVVCDIQRRLTARAGGYVPGSALRVTVTLTLLPSASLQAASPKLTVTTGPLGGTATVTPDYSISRQYCYRTATNQDQTATEMSLQLDKL